mmetsp:Transcript_7834/g.31737  ORF Transcript_7834/g.31737 Transcript_7834/m.31737 type:complete len:229 (-) Transcript_7834:231-917(-)
MVPTRMSSTDTFTSFFAGGSFGAFSFFSFFSFFLPSAFLSAFFLSSAPSPFLASFPMSANVPAPLRLASLCSCLVGPSAPPRSFSFLSTVEVFIALNTPRMSGNSACRIGSFPKMSSPPWAPPMWSHHLVRLTSAVRLSSDSAPTASRTHPYVTRSATVARYETFATKVRDSKCASSASSLSSAIGSPATPYSVTARVSHSLTSASASGDSTPPRRAASPSAVASDAR